MKSYCKVLFVFLFAGGMIAAGSDMASAKTRAVESRGESILQFSDPTEADMSVIDAWLVVAWNKGVTEQNGAFCTARIIAFPEKTYEVVLQNIISSTNDTVEGKWKIIKNNERVVANAVGTVSGLSGEEGSEIIIKIQSDLGRWVIRAVIDYKFKGISPQPEIRGNIILNGSGIPDAVCKMVYWKSGTPGTGTKKIVEKNTQREGTYLYDTISRAQFHRMTHKFRNNDPDLAMTISGYIFGDCMPMAKACVEVVDESGNVLYSGTTNARGHFSTDRNCPIYATGLIRVIIKND
jgi:hypothetical protein